VRWAERNETQEEITIHKSGVNAVALESHNAETEARIKTSSRIPAVASPARLPTICWNHARSHHQHCDDVFIPKWVWK
jgi:hypothetical protein